MPTARPVPWLVVLVLALPGCAVLSPQSSAPARPTPQVVTAAAVANVLTGATANSDVERRIGEAFRLSREGASAAELAKADSLLSGLEDEVGDAGARAIVTLLQRQVTLARSLAAERRRAAKLRGKIDRIKALEQELQQRRLGVDD